jgi:hypothetical protein
VKNKYLFNNQKLVKNREDIDDVKKKNLTKLVKNMDKLKIFIFSFLDNIMMLKFNIKVTYLILFQDS